MDLDNLYIKYRLQDNYMPILINNKVFKSEEDAKLEINKDSLICSIMDYIAQYGDAEYKRGLKDQNDFY